MSVRAILIWFLACLMKIILKTSVQKYNVQCTKYKQNNKSKSIVLRYIEIKLSNKIVSPIIQYKDFIRVQSCQDYCLLSIYVYMKVYKTYFLLLFLFSTKSCFGTFTVVLNNLLSIQAQSFVSFWLKLEKNVRELASDRLIKIDILSVRATKWYCCR